MLANIILLGAAFQLGGFPFALADVETPLQGRGSKANREAFEWGRWAVHDPQAVAAALAAVGGEHVTMSAFEPSARASSEASALLAKQVVPEELITLVRRRVAQVIDYQNTALGQRFLSLVLLVLPRDSAARSWALTRAVIESWFKLLTYKDEYEVARLHNAVSYDHVAKRLGIEGAYTLKYHLHPPLLRRLGLKHKLPLGWLYTLLFILLGHMKWLRGTPLDVFGWDRERRMERSLIEEYRAHLQSALADDALPYPRKLELAASALAIRGYGPVKEQAVVAWRQQAAQLRSP